MDDSLEKIKMAFKIYLSLEDLIQKLRSKPSLRNIGIYFFSNTASKAVPFLTLPVITEALTPQQYGIWGLYTAVFVLIQPFIGLSLVQYFTKTYIKEPHHNQASFLTLAIVINFVTALCFLALFFLLHKAATPLLEIPLIFATIPILGFLTSVKNYLLTLFVLEKNALKYSINSFFAVLAVQTLTIYFIIFQGLGWESLVISTCLAEGAILLQAFYIFFKKGLITFDKIVFPTKSIFLFCLPMVFHSLSAALMGFADRLIIGKMMGSAAVGIYSVGYALGMIALVAAQAFNNVWEPWILTKLAEQSTKAKVQIVKNIYLYAAALCAFCIVVVVAGCLYVDLLIAPEYKSAKIIIFWTAAACLFQGIYFCLYNIFIYTEKTSIFPISTAIASSINIGLSIVLIPILGLVGPALATAFSFLALLLIVIFFQHRYYKLPWLYFLKQNND